MANKSSGRTKLDELLAHYAMAKEVTDQRRTGKNRIGSISFDEADELFRSWLDEDKWPYDALMFDPRVWTFIFEKTSRLITNKLRGRLLPREGGDVLAAHINNELLSFQWDQANHGGTMLGKWALMDINTRKYGASFAVCKWRNEKNAKGETIFNGPEMRVLNNRDCLPDPSATSIETANWFQTREYITIQDLERVNDMAKAGPIYKNLDVIKEAIGNNSLGGGDTRDVEWQSRNRRISGLTSEPVGRDEVFKTVEVVNEYRRDKWYTFSPRHGVLMREADNPYENNEIPITMIRYYQIDDDLYGQSEIEPVKSLQKAINAVLCQYIDEINQKLHSPVAIGPGVRQKTLEWGKGARWIMQNPMTDFRLVESRSNAAAFFNNTYSVLIAAYMSAIGESSLGVTNIGKYQQDKTATEVRQLTQQRNARDSFNQIFLAEAIQRQMRLWHNMNQKMLFADNKGKNHIIRVVGKDAIRYFQEAGLSDYYLPDEAMQLMVGNQDMTQANLEIPKHAVNMGTEESPDMVPKFQMQPKDNMGKLVITQQDLDGTFDFIADVESMALMSMENEKEGRKAAVTALSTNPNIQQLLAAERVKPKFKELFVAWLEDTGFKDAEKFFENIPEQLPTNIPGQPPAVPGSENPNPEISSPVGRPPDVPRGFGSQSTPIIGQGGPEYGSQPGT